MLHKMGKHICEECEVVFDIENHVSKQAGEEVGVCGDCWMKEVGRICDCCQEAFDPDDEFTNCNGDTDFCSGCSGKN